MNKKRLLPAVLLLLLVLTHFSIITFASESQTDPSVPTEAPDATDYAYDPSVEGIVSSYYHIDRERGFILGIAPGTAGTHLRNVCLPAETALSQETVATGAVLSTDTQSLQAIVTGDLNGDANVTITDMLMLKSAILGERLSATAAAASDVNYDNGVTITDFLRIKSALLGKGSIPAGRPSGSAVADPLMLLTPESEAQLQCDGAVQYVSGNESLFTVDSSGHITTLAAEGSAFVYALAEDGGLLQRQMVTVLKEKLAVSLDATAVSMVTGSTHALLASLNHPVEAAVSWKSSNEAVVSVSENGQLTAKQPGEAIITAFLSNGSSAESKITVAPPITSLSIERKLYKVKPGNTKPIKLLVEPAAEGEVFLWESSNPSVASVSGDGVVTGLAYGTVTIKVTGKYSGLTASCNVKICDVKQIALTFDDGPSNYTEKLLDFLKENDVRVTFFLVANRIGYYKEETIREVKEGHEIGYHSYAHDIQTELSSDRIRSDFEKSNQILKDLTGAEFTVWRTPGGGYSDRVLKCVELPHILWSLDTFDWESLNANSVRSQIVRRSADGDIVLIHDLHKTSVEGSIMAIQEMLAGDYEFVTVTELLSRDGTPPENCVTYSNGYAE